MRTQQLIEQARKLADTLEGWYGPHGHAATVRQLAAELERLERKPREGFVEVPVGTLNEWRDQVNTLACLSLKADRHRRGAAIKQSIRDAMESARPNGNER